MQEEEKKVVKAKKEETPSGAVIVQVATATEDMIKLPDGRILNQLEAIATLLNEISSMKQQLGFR